jgi:hypothetical protein
MLTLSSDLIDLPTLERWVGERGLSGAWAQVRDV